MKYKLIAVDMDGTLLTNSKEITPKTIETVKKAQEAGALFAISTGRPIQGVEKYNHLLNLEGPQITYNGAMIVDAKTKKVLFEQGLDREDAKRILEEGRKRGTTMCIWSQNQLYGNVLDERINKYKKLTNVEPLLMENEEELLDQGITKILWYDEVENINAWQEELKEVKFDSVTFCTSQPFFLEFFNSKVSKAVAMEKIGEIYGIKQEEMIAAGDGYNDLAMIEYAGLGVAMENAVDGVKAAAQYITASNEEDGVAKVIEKFIL